PHEHVVTCVERLSVTDDPALQAHGRGIAIPGICEEPHLAAVFFAYVEDGLDCVDISFEPSDC
ncbi:hypothetical protein ACHWGL_31995, partial [Klebsiella pneumoniae]|uniref:hypothetical protein n=1 Tax=Klebsiella pneumoniae TaxID=573 RepID=UPI00376EFA4E